MNIFKLICFFIAIMFCAVELLGGMRMEKSQKNRGIKIGWAALGILCFTILLVDEIWKM